MKQKIKIALCVRAVMVLMGPGLYYLLSNNFISIDNVEAPTTIDNSFTSRQLLSVKDQVTRDDNEPKMETTTLNNESTSRGRLDDARPAKLKFTPSVLTLSERMRDKGWIMLHVLLSCYCFLMLAIICDEYFVGSIEILCSHFKMKSDFMGTFMTIATSFPELFVSCLGTFVTEGDIGVGTIVGSAVFNILAVPALCGIFSTSPVQLEKASVIKDCIFYVFSIAALIAVIYDNYIMWYEAACLVSFYGIYLVYMYKNDVMAEKVKIFTLGLRRRLRVQSYREVTELTPLFIRENILNVKSTATIELSEPMMKVDPAPNDNCATNPWTIAENSSKAFYFLRWPITFMLWCTVPDSRRFKRFYIVTFVFCVLWIGCISYFVVFMSNNVDTVLGLTFLAAGTSIPEAVSSIVMTAQGYGSMGISNTIGSNTFDILLCLGLPWLIKTLILPTISGAPWILLRSTGIAYTTITLLTTLIVLYFLLAYNRFKLDRPIGFVCLAFYAIFLFFAWLVQLNVFLYVNPTICDK